MFSVIALHCVNCRVYVELCESLWHIHVKKKRCENKKNIVNEGSNLMLRYSHEFYCDSLFAV